MIVNLSGRGDKDMETVAEYLGLQLREPAEARA
jgi:tryptophan synthase beta subunit